MINLWLFSYSLKKYVMLFVKKLSQHKFYVIREYSAGKRTDKEIRGAFNKFPDFFVQAFKIVVDS